MTINNQHNKFHLFVLFVIITVAVFLRSYKIDAPLADWHSWRQADTASVAREYVKAGKIDLLHPQFHDLSSIPSGLDNPHGYRMVEFPIRDGLHAWLAMIFPHQNFLVIGRGLSIFFSTVTIITLYLVVYHLSGPVAALSSAFVYSVLPYNIFYGRVILPEPMLVMFSMLSLYFYIKYIDTTKFIYWFATLSSLTFAILLKPTALIILLPMMGYFFASNHKSLKLTISSFMLPAIALVPYLMWRKYIANFSEGIPASAWLFNSNGIRFKGAWFRWLFGERISKMILGYWGISFFTLGIAKLGDNKKETFVYGGLLLGALTYLSVIATGNVQHDYYQIQIMPPIAMLTGIGIAYLISLKKGLGQMFTMLMTAVILLLSCALSWYELKGFFWVNNMSMVEAGQYIDQNTPKESLVIAPYQGDTAFLYQTNRRGWPIGGEIDKKIKMGADYYVTTTKNQEFNELKSQYKVIFENDKFAVIKL